MSQEVSNFCLRMSSARATVRSLEGQVKDKVLASVIADKGDEGDSEK